MFKSDYQTVQDLRSAWRWLETMPPSEMWRLWVFTGTDFGVTCQLCLQSRQILRSCILDNAFNFTAPASSPKNTIHGSYCYGSHWDCVPYQQYEQRGRLLYWQVMEAPSLLLEELSGDYTRFTSLRDHTQSAVLLRSYWVFAQSVTLPFNTPPRNKLTLPLASPLLLLLWFLPKPTSTVRYL